MEKQPSLLSAQAASLEFKQRVGDSLRSASRAFEGAAIFCFESISSTMDAASCYQSDALEASLRDALVSGNTVENPRLAVFVAASQTAGRGRGCREWISVPMSGIYISYLWLPIDQSPKPTAGTGLAGFSLALGLAVQRCLSDFGIVGALKWPNDVLLKSQETGEMKKISGILTEASSSGSARALISAGIGLNLLHQEYPADVPAISMEEGGAKAYDYFEVLGGLSQRVLEYAERYFEDGFCALKQEWWEASIMPEVSLRAGTEKQPLRALGLADDGGLIVADETGAERVVYSGEISIDSFSSC